MQFDRSDFRARVRKAVQGFLAEEDRIEFAQGLLEQSEAEVLTVAIEMVSPLLPMISDKLPNGRRGVALVEGRAETYLYDDGTLEGAPSELVKSFDVRKMLERLLTLFEKQVSGRAAASDRKERRAAKLRLVLRLVVACLESLELSER